VKGLSLLLYYPVSESLLSAGALAKAEINRITGWHRLTWSGIKSVKTINPCKSLIQTIRIIGASFEVHKFLGDGFQE